MQIPMRSGLLAALSLFLLLGPARADEPQAPAAPAPEPAQRLITGYVTEAGNQLPYMRYAPYQSARLRWTAGFVTTITGAAVVATGVGVLFMGGYSPDLTEQGRRNALAAGGVITAVGAAGVAIGATLWHLSRRELGLLERGLPRHQGPMPQASRPELFPTLGLAAGVGAAQVGVGLGGRF